MNYIQKFLGTVPWIQNTLNIFSCIVTITATVIVVESNLP